MLRRRPRSPQGAGSPSATSKGAPHAAPADVEVPGALGTPSVPRPAAGTYLARCDARWIGRRDEGREVWVGEHVGHLMRVQQWPTAHRTVLTLADERGVFTLDVFEGTTVIYEQQGAIQ